jgi:hypothetical protein
MLALASLFAMLRNPPFVDGLKRPCCCLTPPWWMHRCVATRGAVESLRTRGGRACQVEQTGG